MPHNTEQPSPETKYKRCQSDFELLVYLYSKKIEGHDDWAAAPDGLNRQSMFVRTELDNKIAISDVQESAKWNHGESSTFSQQDQQENLQNYTKIWNETERKEQNLQLFFGHFTDAEHRIAMREAAIRQWILKVENLAETPETELKKQYHSNDFRTQETITRNNNSFYTHDFDVSSGDIFTNMHNPIHKERAERMATRLQQKPYGLQSNHIDRSVLQEAHIRRVRYDADITPEKAVHFNDSYAPHNPSGHDISIKYNYLNPYDICKDKNFISDKDFLKYLDAQQKLQNSQKQLKSTTNNLTWPTDMGPKKTIEKE